MYHLNIKLDPENKTLIEVKWSETKFQFKNYDQSNNKFSFSQKPNKPINIFFFFLLLFAFLTKKKKKTWVGVVRWSSYWISLRRSLRMFPSKADLRISEM